MFGISDDPNDVCLQDRLVYTCTVPTLLTWTVGGIQIGSYASGQATSFEGATRTNGDLPGVVANLTEVNGTTLTSTLTISSAGSVANGSVILCEGLMGDRDSTMLRHRGERSGYWMLARSRIASLVLRPHGRRVKWPGIHCLCMHGKPHDFMGFFMYHRLQTVNLYRMALKHVRLELIPRVAGKR